MPDSTYDQPGLERYAAAVAATLRPGDAILLSGPLGAGKTVFSRALIRAACEDPLLEVPSPTYTLLQSYETRHLILHHFDLWRLDGPRGLAELGWEEARAGIVLVEWPDRLGGQAPPDAMHVTLATLPGEAGQDRRLLLVDDRRVRQVANPPRMATR